MSLENVTLNGAPVKEYIDKEVGREIGEVRNADKAVKVRRQIVSKSLRNSSGARTTPGRSVFIFDKKTSHVMVCGTLFPAEAKASAFIIAGHSILGAQEYDQLADEFKCHACGAWRRDIPNHIGSSARSGSSLHTTVAGYRLKYGFKTTTALSVPSIRAAKAAASSNRLPKRVIFKNEHSVLGREARARIKRDRVAMGLAVNPELNNFRDLCIEQRLRDLRKFGATLGRTPHFRELDRFVNDKGYHSLHTHGLRQLFGLPVSKILLRAGFKPRGKGTEGGLQTASADDRRKWARMGAQARWKPQGAQANV